MKPTLTFLILCSLVSACKKEGVESNGMEAYLQQVKAALNDSLDATLFKELDFGKAVLSEVDSVDLHILYVPFTSYNEGHFVVVQTDRFGTIRQGRLVTLVKNKRQDPKTQTSFNGSIEIRTLNKELQLQSAVIEGRILAMHQRRMDNSGAPLSVLKQVQPPGDMLPEVIVIGYRKGTDGSTYSNWINLQPLFGGGGGSGPYYTPADGSGGSGGGTGGNSNGGTGDGGGIPLTRVPPILIDFERQNRNPAIDIEAYLKCFASIPDVGAICSIEILSDIPVDRDPSKLFNWETESPGHTFLQIKKSNGSKSIVQNIGFYPKANWKAIMTPAPVEGKFVDNGAHEFNASFAMNITPEQLQSALIRILYLSKFIKYDIDDYNCTDFALEVFNHVRHPANNLIIPKYDIPGGMAPYGTSTPQGLYTKLKTMKASASAEASNISVPGYKGWVASSHGPCN